MKNKCDWCGKYFVLGDEIVCTPAENKVDSHCRMHKECDKVCRQKGKEKVVFKKYENVRGKV